MAKSKIVLANQSKLLRDMLSRVFAKLEDFIIVQEIENPSLLADFLDQTDIDWVLFSSMHHRAKREWIDDLIRTHPSVCFADIALDMSEVTFTLMNNPDTEVNDLSLEEFIAILESGCLCQSNPQDPQVL
jgi:DNA-binding NarL/FixJ family response regulator